MLLGNVKFPFFLVRFFKYRPLAVRQPYHSDWITEYRGTLQLCEPHDWLKIKLKMVRPLVLTLFRIGERCGVFANAQRGGSTDDLL